MRSRSSWSLPALSLLSALFLACGAPPAAAPSAPRAAPPVDPPLEEPVATRGAASGAAPAVATAAPPALPERPARFDVAAIDAYIAGQLAPRGFVGLSVAVVKDGAVVLDKGYGLSQISPDVPVHAETAFDVGSIAKQMVSAIVLQLAQEKKLSIQDKVARWFPELTRARDITLYDLMTHVSGYHDDYPLDFVDLEMKQPVTPDQVIGRYATRPLDFEPRTRFSYTGTGYIILGRVVEKVTGKPLGAVLEERLWRPLGMAHTSYMPAAGGPGLAHGYTSFALGSPEAAEPEARGWGYGAGGVWAPAGDVATWALALMSGKVLAPSSYATLTTSRRLADGRTTGYGCGIAVNTSRSGETVLEHDGGCSGFTSYVVMLPRTRSAVVVLSNRDDAGPWELVHGIVDLIDGETRTPPLAVQGPPAAEVARAVFAMLQAGHVDRSLLGDDFNLFLTDAKLQGASVRLAPLGAPTSVEVQNPHARGGMEMSTVRLTFASTKLEAEMFRSLDGKVQQFLVYRR
jgi:D-alanyl-D-alanine carboxypeptidase